MLKQFLYAAALPLEVAGLFAIWNWSRRSRAFGWVLLGSAILLSLAGLVASVANPFGGRFYAGFFGMYLFSGLMWAWWLEGLRPHEWQVRECFVALAAVGLFGLANSSL